MPPQTATLVEDRPVPMPPARPVHRAQSLQLNADGDIVSGRHPVDPPVKEDAEEPTVLHGSRATRVTDVTEREQANEEHEVPDWMKEFGDDELKGLEERRQADGGLDKSLLHAQRKIKEQGETLGALQQQLNDVLAAHTLLAKSEPGLKAVESEPNIEALQQQLDAIGQSFLDDIPGNLKKLTALNADLAHAKLAPILKQQATEKQLVILETLEQHYPGLVATEADASWIGIAARNAASAAGTSTGRAHYEQAFADYAKKVGYKKAGAVQQPNADVDKMKATAQQAPTSATVKEKPKIWSRSELDQLLTKHPEKYRELQPQILRAYRENRVR